MCQKACNIISRWVVFMISSKPVFHFNNLVRIFLFIQVLPKFSWSLLWSLVLSSRTIFFVSVDICSSSRWLSKSKFHYLELKWQNNIKFYSVHALTKNSLKQKMLLRRGHFKSSPIIRKQGSNRIPNIRWKFITKARFNNIQQ